MLHNIHWIGLIAASVGIYVYDFYDRWDSK